jgi:hypothetical protein
MVAAKGLNDPYEYGKSYERWIEDKNALDLLGIRGERQFNLMAVVIFKHLDYCPIELDSALLYKRPLDPNE